jgi:hypothetical protein
MVKIVCSIIYTFRSELGVLCALAGGISVSEDILIALASGAGICDRLLRRLLFISVVTRQESCIGENS